MTKLMPRQAVPALRVQTLDHGTYELSAETPKALSLVVFYRGLHCPICGLYLKDLDSKLAAFAENGVDAIAISSDTAQRAREAHGSWKLEHLRVGYGLDTETAKAWGLYFSNGIGKTSIGIEEPELFSEPGLFLVKPDGTLYFGTTQTMPFARPDFGGLLKSLGFVLAKNYPARGEVDPATI